MPLRMIALLAILFISAGFILFLIALFTQSYNWFWPISLFAVGIVLYFVASAKFKQQK